MSLNESVYDEWQLTWIEECADGPVIITNSIVGWEYSSIYGDRETTEFISLFEYDGTREGFQAAFWAWDEQQGIPF
jgi:hypothetical protein